MDENIDYSEGVSVKQVALKWGLILGLIAIALFIIFQVTGLSQNQGVQYIGIIPTIIVIVMAHKAFKEGGDGFMSYGQGLGIGTLTTLISGLISSIFSFIYFKLIDDSSLEMGREKVIQQYEEAGMSDAQIEQSMKFVDMFMDPTVLLIVGIISSVFLGFIISLIVSAITKNSNPQEI